LCLLNDTTPHELRCLLNDNVTVQQWLDRVWYAQAHDSAGTAVVVYGLDHNGEGEE
jgi:hypothetical protein